MNSSGKDSTTQTAPECRICQDSAPGSRSRGYLIKVSTEQAILSNCYCVTCVDMEASRGTGNIEADSEYGPGVDPEHVPNYASTRGSNRNDF